MVENLLEQLAQLIDRKAETLLVRWRVDVRELPAARDLDVPTLNDHIPQLLAEIVAALRIGSDESIAHALREGSPTQHGLQRVHAGYDIEEVVAEYNILRDCIHDLANDAGLSLQGKPFHVLNRVMDGAIGVAVRKYATHQANEVRRRREEYLAFVAHDLRTPLNAISMSVQVLESIFDRDQASDGKTALMLKTLTRNVGHLKLLIDKVLDENSHLNTELGIRLVRRQFDLWPLVQALIQDIEPIAGRGTTQIVNAVPDEPRGVRRRDPAPACLPEPDRQRDFVHPEREGVDRRGRGRRRGGRMLCPGQRHGYPGRPPAGVVHPTGGRRREKREPRSRPGDRQDVRRGSRRDDRRGEQNRCRDDVPFHPAGYAGVSCDADRSSHGDHGADNDSVRHPWS